MAMNEHLRITQMWRNITLTLPSFLLCPVKPNLIVKMFKKEKEEDKCERGV